MKLQDAKFIVAWTTTFGDCRCHPCKDVAEVHKVFGVLTNPSNDHYCAPDKIRVARIELDTVEGFIDREMLNRKV